MRRGEVDVRIACEDRLLDPEVLDAHAENGSGGRRGSKRLEIAAPQWPFPDKMFVLHRPTAVAERGALRSFGQTEREPPNVIPTRHTCLSRGTHRLCAQLTQPTGSSPKLTRPVKRCWRFSCSG